MLIKRIDKTDFLRNNMTPNRVNVSIHNCFGNKIDCHWLVSVHLTTNIILVLRSTQNIYGNNVIIKAGWDSGCGNTFDLVSGGFHCLLP